MNNLKLFLRNARCAFQVTLQGRRLNYQYLLLVFLLISCQNREEACETYYEYLREENGVIKIDTIYHEWADDADTAMDSIGNKLLFSPGDFDIQPKIGDTLIKEKGLDRYTLLTKDTIYFLWYNCLKKRNETSFKLR